MLEHFRHRPHRGEIDPAARDDACNSAHGTLVACAVKPAQMSTASTAAPPACDSLADALSSAPFMQTARLVDRFVARLGDRTNIFNTTSLERMVADHRIGAIDVGSRGGFEADLLPIAWAVDALGFEPDPEEYARLAARDGHSWPWNSVRHVPVAVSGSGGVRKLNIPVAPQSASLFEHDVSVGKAFALPEMFTVERVVDVETMTLDDALGRYSVPAPHYLKLDIEGAELEVLSSAPRTIEHLLVIKTEVGFLPMRKNQPLATDLDQFLRERGFQLVDFVRPAHWRRGSNISHPQLSGGRIPYSRGELAHGDFLYFKRADLIPPDAVATAVRAAVLSMAHGYFDYANALLTRPAVASQLREQYRLDVADALRSASLRFGRRVWAEAFATHLRRMVTFLRSTHALVAG
jgi:FkbM family methyltransferase